MNDYFLTNPKGGSTLKINANSTETYCTEHFSKNIFPLCKEENVLLFSSVDTMKFLREQHEETLTK